MASSSYSASDQAADLGIHRVHSLVLGDPRREARIAARLSPLKLNDLFWEKEIFELKNVNTIMKQGGNWKELQGEII